jgi:hypothetical protein
MEIKKVNYFIHTQLICTTSGGIFLVQYQRYIPNFGKAIVADGVFGYDFLVILDSSLEIVLDYWRKFLFKFPENDRNRLKNALRNQPARIETLEAAAGIIKILDAMFNHSSPNFWQFPLNDFPTNFPHLDAFLDMLNMVFTNGGLLFKRVQTNPVDLAHIKPNAADPVFFLSLFRNNKNLRKIFPETMFQMRGGDEIISGQKLNSEYFYKSMLDAVHKGGAVPVYSLAPSERKAITQKFLDFLFEKYLSESSSLYEIKGAWTYWFKYAGWDYSWVIIDWKKGNIWFWMITDY